MKTTPRIIISFAAVILSLCIYACKDYIETPVIAEESAKGIFKSKGILPINLDEFNILANNETKSSFTDTVTFSLDSSMLNWGKASQVNRDNGLVFTQIPFSFNDSSVFAAISDDMETLDEHKVSLKSFYIKAEDCFNNVQIDYIVTMVPTREYQVHNVEYDFLNMQGFSGIVFYSDTIGRVFKINALKDGIINRVSLSKETEIDNPKYVGFYSNDRTITKSDQDPVFDGGVLTTIIVTADSSNQPGDKIKVGRHPESPSQEKPEEIVDHTDKPAFGGNLFEEYTLTIVTKGCHSENKTITVSTGNSLTIVADNPSDRCIFMYWIYDSDILSNNRTITITPYENTTVYAYYVGEEDTACFNLAKLSSDSLLRNNINELLNMTLNNRVENGFIMCSSDSSMIYGTGSTSGISYPDIPEKTYLQRFHTHPPDSTQFCGGADIWCIYSMIFNEKIRNEDIQTFRYGMISYQNQGFHEIHIINIVDKTQLLAFFKKYEPVSKSKKHQKEAMIKFKSFFEPMVFRKDVTDYDKILLKYTSLLNEMGLSLTRGRFSADSTHNSSGFIRWNKIGIKENNDATELNTIDCKSIN